MPTISTFYGIVVLMFYLDTEHHHRAHFHARYAEFSASIALDDLTVLAGRLPAKQLRLVLAWAEIHRDELIENWERAARGDECFKIAPLI